VVYSYGACDEVAGKPGNGSYKSKGRTQPPTRGPSFMDCLWASEGKSRFGSDCVVHGLDSRHGSNRDLWILEEGRPLDRR
jgi:hypothetical protein